MFQHRGIWYTRVPDETGVARKRSLRTSDERVAIVRESDLRRTASLPPSERKETLSLAAALGKVVAAKRRERSPDTVTYYEWKARSLTTSLGPVPDVRHITASVIDRLVECREADGVSVNTISKELGVLFQALSTAWRLKAYDADPRSVMPQGFSDCYKPRERVLSQKELETIISECSNSDQIVYVCFAVATSARHREIRRAVRGDIDLKSDLIRLHGTKTEGAARWVPITPLSRPYVDRILQQVRPGPETPLVSTNLGKGAFLGKFCRRLKIPHVSPNDLRRTCATWLVEHGVELYHVSKILGHKDTRMVERVYGQLRKEVLARLVNAQIQEHTTRMARQNTLSGNGETNGDKLTGGTPPNGSNQTSKSA